eukprot:10994270-Lingulodinium_polyedra.AAC.1
MPMQLISVRKLTVRRKEKCQVASHLVSNWTASLLAKNESLLTEYDETPLPNRNTGGMVGV